MKTLSIKLKSRRRSLLAEWGFIILSITLMMYFYYLFTWWSMSDYLESGLLGAYAYSGYALLEIGMQGIIIGILFGLVGLLLDSTRLGRKSFGFVILFKSLFYFLAAMLSQLIVIVIYRLFNITSPDLIRDTSSEISVELMIGMSLYFIFVLLLINFILQVNRKFGPGTLFSMLIGKYHKPKIENRIFMFLDMKDSTGNAEKLGHVRYSRLIQSCIHELTDLIIPYKAAVYQYVGDEIVLSWPSRKGLKDLNCILIFYAFKQRLESQADSYLKEYNICPEFKAGLSEGSITVTEVGDIKREIAYHGKVLHSAARLEKMCKELDKEVLLTESLASKLPSENGCDLELLGKYQLRGKEKKENVYGIKW